MSPSIVVQGRRATPPVVDRDGVVLVVDDDEPVRELCRRTLESIGYTVLTAGSGTDAIAAAQAWEGAIDVLLTDVVMPGLHGSELARAIRTDRPDIRVILTSGYAAELVDRPTNLREFGEFLPKPFKVPALQLAVARAMSGAVQPPLGSPRRGPED